MTVKKSDGSMRWTILFLNCVLMVSVYFSYDIPAAMKSQLEDYMGLLYTLPAFPNVILPFFGGYFVDRLGVRSCLLVFISVIAVGQVVFCFGLSIKSWPIMLLGRAIFGCGETSNSVANSAIVAEWFEDKELAFAFGFNLSIARMGSVSSNFVSPILALTGGVVVASWFGALLLGLGVISVLIMIPIDANAEKSVKNFMKSKDGNDSQYNSGAHESLLSYERRSSDALNVSARNEKSKEIIIHDVSPQSNASLSNVFKFRFPYWMLTASCLLIYGVILPFNNIAGTLLLERNFFMDPPGKCVLTIPYQCQSGSNKPLHCPSSHFYQPPLPVNITIDDKYYKKVEASDVQCTDDVWKDDCTEEFCDRHASGIIRANTIMSIPYFMAAVLFPVCGQLVDWYGMRAVGLTVAPMVLVLVHSLLGFSRVDPIPLMVGQGLAYSIMASSLWPAIPLVVDPNSVGLAYGTAFSMQNVGLTIIPLIMAAIYSSSGDTYIPNVEVFLIVIAGSACVVGIWLCQYDMSNGGDLNAPMKSVQREFSLVLNDDEADDSGAVRDAKDTRASRTSSHSVSSVHSELLALR